MTQDQLLRGEEPWELGTHSSGGGPGRCSCWGDLVLRCAPRGRPSVSLPCLQPRVSQSTSDAASLFISSVHNPYLGKSPGGEFIFAASGRCRGRDAGPRSLCGNCPHPLTRSTCFVVSELLLLWFLTEVPQSSPHLRGVRRVVGWEGMVCLFLQWGQGQRLALLGQGAACPLCFLQTNQPQELVFHQPALWGRRLPTVRIEGSESAKVSKPAQSHIARTRQPL